MAHTQIFKYFALAAFVAPCLSSCLMESEGDCDTHLNFVYDYNMQGTDGFAAEVDEISVFVFNEEGALVTTVGGQTGDDFSIDIPSLPSGRYKMIAWARSDKTKSPDSNFELSYPAKGNDYTDIQARIKTVSGISSHAINNTLYGVLDADITGRGQHLTVKMKKCNNDLRVVLMPIRASQTMNKDDYEIKVTAENAWLAYDGSKYKASPVEYIPHLYEESSSDGTKADETISTAVVGDLAMSRLFETDDSRLIVKSLKSGREVLNIRLEWLLTLQAINEHDVNWSDQEYLDRQDEYSITFFVDDSTWMDTRIIVNGWVLSLEDAVLN